MRPPSPLCLHRASPLSRRALWRTTRRVNGTTRDVHPRPLQPYAPGPLTSTLTLARDLRPQRTATVVEGRAARARYSRPQPGLAGVLASWEPAPLLLLQLATDCFSRARVFAGEEARAPGSRDAWSTYLPNSLPPTSPEGWAGLGRGRPHASHSDTPLPASPRALVCACTWTPLPARDPSSFKVQRPTPARQTQSQTDASPTSSRPSKYVLHASRLSRQPPGSHPASEQPRAPRVTRVTVSATARVHTYQYDCNGK